ncbi:hypothetical protein Q7P37_003732 [Cladosporium fusiforme]
MANYLASIFGTEQDKVNCSFYYKIGACRHGDRCSRKHVKPSYSQTILLPNLYQNPAYDGKSRMTPAQLQNHFDAFYEDFWCEMCKFGEIEEVVVCDNNNDHLIGNVYARFKYEDSAQAASENLNSRWYGGRPIYAELSPVTDFREACCRLNSGEGCVRGGFCNFIHRKEPSPELDRELELATKKWLRERGRDERSVSRSASPEPARPSDIVNSDATDIGIHDKQEASKDNKKYATEYTEGMLKREAECERDNAGGAQEEVGTS